MADTDIDRKQLRIPDAFVRMGQKGLNWIADRRPLVLGTLGGLAVLGLGIWGWNTWQFSRETRAWAEYYDLNKVTGDEYWRRLAQLHAKLRKTRAGLLMATKLGDHFLGEARKAVLEGKESKASALQAQEWYQKGLASSGLSALEEQLLLVNRGTAAETLGQLDVAAKDYEKASQIEEAGKGWALVNLARIHELQGKEAPARQIYERVVQDYPNSELSKYGRNQLRRMTSPLFRKGKNS